MILLMVANHSTFLHSKTERSNYSTTALSLVPNCGITISKNESPFHCSLLNVLSIPLQHCGFIKRFTHRQSFSSKETHQSLLVNVTTSSSLQNKLAELMRSCVFCYNCQVSNHQEMTPISCDNLLEHNIVMLVSSCHRRIVQHTVCRRQLERRLILSEITLLYSSLRW